MGNTEQKSQNAFPPYDYWEERLRRNPDLRGTGHRQFSMAYNEALYRIATARLQAALDCVGIDLNGKQVLDVGAGLGYFVQQYINRGAQFVTGVDITQVSVQELRRRFPGHEFIQADISEAPMIPREYDLVSAIGVMFHIVDDDRFLHALKNICARVKANGYLLIVDSFNYPIIPSARHTRLRSLRDYQSVLRDYGFVLRDIRPLFYVMGQSFIPVVGPRLSSWPPILNLLLRFENWMATRFPTNWYFLKIMIAQRQNIAIPSESL